MSIKKNLCFKAEKQACGYKTSQSTVIYSNFASLVKSNEDFLPEGAREGMTRGTGLDSIYLRTYKKI